MGAPFGSFTCVVGPNGCGKSVVVSALGAGCLDGAEPARGLLRRQGLALHAAPLQCRLSAPAKHSLSHPVGCLQGEAIAFALGGNARMMRARNLGSLDNTAPPAASAAAGEVEPAAPPAAAAEVILHFDVLAPQGQPTNDGSSGSSSGANGANGGLSSAAPAAAAAEGRLPAARLLIRRRVTRAGRSDFAVQQLPAAAAAVSEAGDAPSGTLSGSGSNAGGQWQSATPAGLHTLLAPFGIQTEAIDRWACHVPGACQLLRHQPAATCSAVGPPCPLAVSHLLPQLNPACLHPRAPRRFVVTQHRQPVAVAEPVQLARFLELLIGTSGLEAELAALAAEAGRQAGEYDALEENMAE